MENYTLRTAFPDASCSEVLANAEVLNIKADINKRSISADVICNDIADYRDVENFSEEVKKSYEIAEFDLNIKFRKTKQKVITLVAAILKTLLAVAKANGRFSRRKLNASNVYDLSLSFLIHMLPHYQKKVCNRSHTPKNTNSDCCHTN